MRQLDATFSLRSVFDCVAEEILHFSFVSPGALVSVCVDISRGRIYSDKSFL